MGPRLVREPAELRGVALADALAESTAVSLGLDGLASEQLPRVLVAREDALVCEQDRGARSVQFVASVDRGPQIASEPAHVTDDEHVVVGAGAPQHVAELCGIANRAAAVRDGP